MESFNVVFTLDVEAENGSEAIREAEELVSEGFGSGEASKIK